MYRRLAQGQAADQHVAVAAPGLAHRGGLHRLPAQGLAQQAEGLLAIMAVAALHLLQGDQVGRVAPHQGDDAAEVVAPGGADAGMDVPAHDPQAARRYG